MLGKAEKSISAGNFRLHSSSTHLSNLQPQQLHELTLQNEAISPTAQGVLPITIYMQRLPAPHPPPSQTRHPTSLLLLKLPITPLPSPIRHHGTPLPPPHSPHRPRLNTLSPRRHNSQHHSLPRSPSKLRFLRRLPERPRPSLKRCLYLPLHRTW